MNRIDKALDAFWIGFIYVGICRIKGQYHKAISNYYLGKLRQVRGKTRAEIDLSRRAIQHETYAELAVAHLK
jgi:hypothetical protein